MVMLALLTQYSLFLLELESLHFDDLKLTERTRHNINTAVATKILFLVLSTQAQTMYLIIIAINLVYKYTITFVALAMSPEIPVTVSNLSSQSWKYGLDRKNMVLGSNL